MSTVSLDDNCGFTPAGHQHTCLLEVADVPNVNRPEERRRLCRNVSMLRPVVVEVSMPRLVRLAACVVTFSDGCQ